MENKRYYEDFEPFCKWRKEETEDVLEVHLPGFKKEHLRIQINSLGVLTISGERPVDETKWPRFRKVFNVPKYCNLKEIHAKFSGGVLYVIMKKKVSSRNKRNQYGNPNQQTTDQGYSAAESGEAATSTTAHATLSMNKARQCLSALKSSVLGLKMGRNTARRLGASVGFVVALIIGTYVAYNFRHLFHFDD